MTSSDARREPVSRVVLLVDAPFSTRNRDRYGVETLLSGGLDVEVWDVSPWLRPIARDQWFDRPEGVLVHECVNSDDFEARVATLTRSAAVVMIAGVWDVEPASYGTLWARLATSPAQLCAIASGHLPSPKASHRVWLIATRIRTGAAPVRWLAGGIRSRIRRVFAPRNRVASGLKLELAQRSDRVLDRIWAGVQTQGIRAELIGPSTTVRFVHVLDYDLILDVRAREASVDSSAVFLDTMGPLHPDFVTMALPSGASIEQYSAAVCGSLDRIERESGLRVVVAAHPRAEVGLLEPWYGGRKIVYGDTAFEIARSRLVLAADATTSLGLAVVLRKPITLITTRALALATRMWLRVFRDELKVTILDADDPQATWQLPAPNVVAYDEYVAAHIKRPGTPEHPFWAVVLDDLTARGRLVR